MKFSKISENWAVPGGRCQKSCISAEFTLTPKYFTLDLLKVADPFPIGYCIVIALLLGSKKMKIMVFSYW